MKQLKEYVNECINKYPRLRGEILGFYELCLDEIEAGESRENEISLCYGSIKDLIEEEQ